MANSYDDTIQKWMSDSASISEERLLELDNLAELTLNTINKHGQAELLFVCTHNSRRSQIAELLCFAILNYFKVEEIDCLSAGTEQTHVNKRIIKAMRSAGFGIETSGFGDHIKYDLITENAMVKVLYSKTLDHILRKGPSMITVMVCDDADQNCPYVPDTIRFSLNYTDPKFSDDSPEEPHVYADKVDEIGRELTHLVSSIVALKNASNELQSS